MIWYVPMNKLFQVLNRLGCGAVMLAAMVAVYSVTQNVIGSALVTTTFGVRQGLQLHVCFLLSISMTLSEW